MSIQSNINQTLGIGTALLSQSGLAESVKQEKLETKAAKEAIYASRKALHAQGKVRAVLNESIQKPDTVEEFLDASKAFGNLSESIIDTVEGAIPAKMKRGMHEEAAGNMIWTARARRELANQRAVQAQTEKALQQATTEQYATLLKQLRGEE